MELNENWEYGTGSSTSDGPITRSRAQEDGTPGESAALSYAQRVTIGP